MQAMTSGKRVLNQRGPCLQHHLQRKTNKINLLSVHRQAVAREEGLFFFFYKLSHFLTKLLQTNWLWARFCLLSDSNHHLINIFDPNSWNLSQLSQRNQLYLVRIISKSRVILKKNQNWSNSINFFDMIRPFQYKLTFSIF